MHNVLLVAKIGVSIAPIGGTMTRDWMSIFHAERRRKKKKKRGRVADVGANRRGRKMNARSVLPVTLVLIAALIGGETKFPIAAKKSRMLPK